MSDEEDFDEFPSIEVNSPLQEAKSFLMPSAEAVAAARAREAATESELRRLHEEHPVSVLAAAASDSSGSEGEAALAAAVAALRVLPPPRAPPAAAPPPHLLAALQAALPPPPSPFLHHYMDATRDRTEAEVATLTRELLRDVSEMAYETASASDVQLWPEEEYLGICAWVCALAAAGGGGGCGGGGRVRRTLHVLVDDVGGEVQAEALRGVVARAAGSLGARAALQLCGALQSGSERGARLAADLATRALAALAGLPLDQEEVTLEECGRALGGGGGWRRLAPPRRYLALQLLARGGGGAGARRALAALQAAPQQQGRAHSADMLKVLVAASKLSVLFHVQE